MGYDFKWIQPNMSLYNVNPNCQYPISILNSGNLAIVFINTQKIFLEQQNVLSII